MPLRLHEIHPSVVHFPLTLFPLAILADLLGTLTRSRALKNVGAKLMPLAAGSAVVTGAAGLLAQEAAKPRGPAHDVLATHRNMNLALIGLSLGMALRRSRRTDPGPVYLLAGVAAVAAMNYTAYLGGKMVYEHGVGVQPAGGFDETYSPEIRRENVREVLRTSREHMRHGIRHAAEAIREGKLAPALTQPGAPASAAPEQPSQPWQGGRTSGDGT